VKTCRWRCRCVALAGCVLLRRRTAADDAVANTFATSATGGGALGAPLSLLSPARRKPRLLAAWGAYRHPRVMRRACSSSAARRQSWSAHQSSGCPVHLRRRRSGGGVAAS
jgi:hypothetical protein